ERPTNQDDPLGSGLVSSAGESCPDGMGDVRFTTELGGQLPRCCRAVPVDTRENDRSSGGLKKSQHGGQVLVLHCPKDDHEGPALTEILHRCKRSFEARGIVGSI